MSARRVAIAALVLVLLGGGAALVWWVLVPHDATQMLARARRLEAEIAPAPPEQREKDIVATLDAYERVSTFPDMPAPRADAHTPHEDALRDEVKLLSREKRTDEAIARLKSLLARTPPPADAADLRLRPGEWREQAGAWKLGREAYLEASKDDLAALSPTATALEAAQEPAYRAAVILDDRLPDAVPGDVLASWMKFIEDFPRSPHAPDALFRLATRYRKVGEKEQAIATFRRLADDYPGSELAARALREIGLIYGEELDRPKEAIRAFKELDRKFPGSRAAQGSRGERREQEKKAAEREEEDYAKGHYGGHAADWGEMVPPTPREALAELIAEKLDFQTMRVDARIEPADARLSASVTITATHAGERARRDLLLSLASAITVTAARVGGKTAIVERDGNLLRLTFARDWPPGEVRDVEVTYSGEFAQAGGMTYIGPDGGFGIGEGSWIPGDVVGDLFTGSASFTVPEGFVAIATGSLQTPTQSATAGERRFVYTTELPVYGLHFAFGRFQTSTGDWHGKPISVHSLTPGFARGQELVDEARAILDFYSARFGDFQWPKLDIVEADLPVFIAGVGPATILYLEKKTFAADAKAPRNLMAHELAHQWWGNVVPPTLAPGYAPWLSEGMATYADALYFASREGAEAGREHLTKYAHLYYEITLHAPDQPLDDAWMSSPAYRAIAYEKAARTLHMIHVALGDDAFFKGLRLYAEKNAFKESTTDSLRLAFEEAGKVDLAGFFADWTRRSGVPKLSIAEVRSSRGGASPGPGSQAGSAFAVECVVREDGPVFRVPAIDVLFTSADGRTERRRGALQGKPEESLRFDLPFAPAQAVLDPDDDVLKIPLPALQWPVPARVASGADASSPESPTGTATGE